LKELPYRQAIEIRHNTFKSDVQRLLATIEHILTKGPVGISRERTDEPEWEVTVVKADNWNLLLNVQLDYPHTLEVRTRLTDSIWLDGRPIVRVTLTGFMMKKRYRFEILDGRAVRQAELNYISNSKVRLIIDDRLFTIVFLTRQHVSRCTAVRDLASEAVVADN
jgi:hypothetical protein